MTESKDLPVVELDMICIHSDEGIAQGKALMEDVYRRLECDDSTFLTQVVYSLNWDYGAWISAIHADMWAAVYVKTETAMYRAQCDNIEHGIAAIWQYLADNEKKIGDD